MPDLPPIEGGAYLLDYLWQLGPTMAVGMGAGPITQTEMRAWQINMGIDLKPWEARFLRGLSCDYLDQWQKAQKPDCAPPWQAVATAIDKAAVANRMLNAIRQMAGS